MRNLRTAPRRRLALVCTALGSMLIASCGKQTVVEEAPVVRPVRVFEVGSRVTTRIREYPGAVAPHRAADVSFEVAGRIVALPVREGQWVREGDLLAQLDPSNFEADFDSAEANRAAAEADFERYKALLEKNAVSQRDFEARQRNFEVAQANLRIARKALEDTKLVAPFPGRVARTLVDEFQNVQAKETVLILQDDTTLEIVVSVPESDLAGVNLTGRFKEISQRLNPQVTVSSLADQQFPARLTELATTADPTTRTFDATFAFDVPDEISILSGMTASVAATLSENIEGLGFPIPTNAAVIGDAGGSYVWKIDPGSMEASRVDVELGEFFGESVQVTDGLGGGDLIAASGVHHLREGMQVRRLDG